MSFSAFLTTSNTWLVQSTAEYQKDTDIYYSLNREIQEFLVKMKMLFLISLNVFISSREINLCKLDTFPIMVRIKSSMYNRVPTFRTT